MIARFGIPIIGFGTLVLATFQAEPASARHCYWDGSSPICRGRCQSGYQTVAVQSCFNGYKVKCCERMGSTTHILKKKKKNN